VPDSFPVYDVRKPADEYVQDRLSMVIREMFEMRKNVEQKMTRAELAAFDKVLAKRLQKDQLLPALKEAISRDYSFINTSRAVANYVKD
jgi:hypothetical protein